MKLFVALLGVALLGGCTALGLKKKACSSEGAIISPVVSFVASPAGLDCSHPEEIAKDIEGFIATLGVCEIAPSGHAPETLGGPIGSLACPPMVSWAISHYVNNSDRLQRWGCKGTGVQAAFMAACQFIPI